jgi:hypothetical protein
MGNEQDLLNMAEDFKNIVKQKDTMIEIYKDKMNYLDRDLREIEYKLSQLGFLCDYKIETSPKEEKPFLKRIIAAIKFMEVKIDKSRICCQEEIDEDDLILHLHLD